MDLIHASQKQNSVPYTYFIHYFKYMHDLFSHTYMVRIQVLYISILPLDHYIFHHTLIRNKAFIRQCTARSIFEYANWTRLQIKRTGPCTRCKVHVLQSAKNKVSSNQNCFLHFLYCTLHLIHCI